MNGKTTQSKRSENKYSTKSQSQEHQSKNKSGIKLLYAMHMKKRSLWPGTGSKIRRLAVEIKFGISQPLLFSFST